MYVLGIESSCDETAAAIVKDGKTVLSNIINSSLSYHQKYGGIIPEIASRKHIETITSVVECAVKEAKIDLKQVDLIAVTAGPGLIGCLVVGLEFAKSLSLALSRPILGINHLYGHIYAAYLNSGIQPPLPVVALVVSGGHTSLYLLKDFDDIKLLGSTSDDACGEAFDKVAKILGLGYPGGPIIEKIALQGNPKQIKFSCSNNRNPLDFSFSGIKTGVLYYARKNNIKNKKTVADICASFQESAVNTLIDKAFHACEINGVKNLIVCGGVAANNRLRDRFQEEKNKIKGLKTYFPAKILCTDNAAMVAGIGYQLFKKGYRDNLRLNLALN